MTKGYKGGCFSLKVPPVFCGNGSLLLIPRGRSNEIHVYETLGGGEPISKFSASREVVTGLGVLRSDQGEEFVVTATFDGLIRIFALEAVLGQKETPLVEMRVGGGQSVIDLKVVGSTVYILAGHRQQEEDAVLGPEVTLYRISGTEVWSRLGSGGGDKGADSGSWLKLLSRVVDFSYGALSFQVSQDESLFYFVWKNLLLLWSVEHPDRIIRFRHSEYILSLTVSEDKRFVATGDAYGRLTYWFIPPLLSKEGIQMWRNAPSISEHSDIEKMVYRYNVKTSISHWHSHELTCLGMIPGTDVVLSGGEEAVLVLWRQTFSSDSYLVHSKSQFKNPSNNGTRQFIPRLGAPIYNISTFRKERRLVSNPEENGVASSGSPGQVSQSKQLPPLVAAIVCSDNSVKILDLVHNRILSSIYGVATPFNAIKGALATSPRMKMLASQQLGPGRLLVSVIGHPFKLHVHDLLRDAWCSSVLCKPEESYVSSVGEGLSSSRLVQEDVTKVTLVDAYFSRDSRLAVTVESQKFDHMSDERRVYNLQFWRVFSSGGLRFELMSRYPIAHVDSLVSIEEAESEGGTLSREERARDWPCLITTSCRGEIKCWAYKSQVGEWVNSSIIHGAGELDLRVYSTCFSRAFSKLFLASSRGVITYNWNRQHSVLMESDIGYLSGGDAQITQLATLVHEDEHYLLGLSSSPGKLFLWSITSMELVLEEDLAELGPDSRLICPQGGAALSRLGKQTSFQFALVRNRDAGEISLFRLRSTKKPASKAGPEVGLECLRELRTELFEGTSIKDAIIQPRIESSKISIYLVLLLSSCDIYIQEIETLDRSDVVSQAALETKTLLDDQDDEKKKTPALEKDRDEEETASSILDIQTSIANMFLAATRDDVLKKKKEEEEEPGRRGTGDSALSNLSKTVQSILSHSGSSDHRLSKQGLNSNSAASSKSSFSSLYCLRLSGAQTPPSSPHAKKSLNNLSKNLNTYMCPPPSTLFWNLVNNHYSSSNFSYLNTGTTSGTGINDIIIRGKSDDNNTNFSGGYISQYSKTRTQVFGSKQTGGTINGILSGRTSSSMEDGNDFSYGDLMTDQVLKVSESLKPLQTQKLQSILKRITFNEKK